MTTSNVNRSRMPDIPQEAPTADAIGRWIGAYLASLLDISPQEVSLDSSIEDLGLDSSVVVALSGDLEEWLGCDLDPAIMFDAPTLQMLAERLAAQADG